MSDPTSTVSMIERTWEKWFSLTFPGFPVPKLVPDLFLPEQHAADENLRSRVFELQAKVFDKTSLSQAKIYGNLTLGSYTIFIKYLRGS